MVKFAWLNNDGEIVISEVPEKQTKAIEDDNGQGLKVVIEINPENLIDPEDRTKPLKIENNNDYIRVSKVTFSLSEEERKNYKGPK